MAAGPGHRPYGEGFPATRQPDPHFARVTPNLDHSIEGDIVEKLSFLAVTVTDETNDRTRHGTGNPPRQVLDIPGDDRTRMVASTSPGHESLGYEGRRQPDSVDPVHGRCPRTHYDAQEDERPSAAWLKRSG